MATNKLSEAEFDRIKVIHDRWLLSSLALAYPDAEASRRTLDIESAIDMQESPQLQDAMRSLAQFTSSLLERGHLHHELRVALRRVVDIIDFERPAKTRPTIRDRSNAESYIVERIVSQAIRSHPRPQELKAAVLSSVKSDLENLEMDATGERIRLARETLLDRLLDLLRT